MELEVVEIGPLPLYNPDLDEAPPEAWAELRSRVRRADAVV